MYEKMFAYAHDFLKTDTDSMPFRSRYEHTRRVFGWCKRLLENEPSVNREAVLAAAVFHDTGYAKSPDDSQHGAYSAEICEKYLSENGYPGEFINKVSHLVANHSKKQLLKEKGTSLELIVLMEADLLDETGAMSILWDCMAEGSSNVQTYEKAYHHILNYSLRRISYNPMVTGKARKFWEDKQRLTHEFIVHLMVDLGIESLGRTQ